MALQPLPKVIDLINHLEQLGVDRDLVWESKLDKSDNVYASDIGLLNPANPNDSPVAIFPKWRATE